MPRSRDNAAGAFGGGQCACWFGPVEIDEHTGTTGMRACVCWRNVEARAETWCSCCPWTQGD